MRGSAIGGGFERSFWLAIWLTIRWWCFPEHPEFLRFQGLLGLVRARDFDRSG